MRKIIILLFVLAFLTSCDKQYDTEPQIGAISLAFSGKSVSGGRISEATSPAAIILSIDDTDGQHILTDKKLFLLTFGQEFVTESIELTVGNYKLTKFYVIDSSNKLLYATPLEGSELAQYVSDPLSIDFSVTGNTVSEIRPEVLPVTETETPAQFGYANFGFDIVEIGSHPIILKVKLIQPLSDTPYDSAFISFNNEAAIIKKKLDLHNSTSVDAVIATGIVEGIMPGNWHVSISYFRTLIPDQKSAVTIGKVDLTILQTTADLLSSLDASLAIVGDSKDTIAKTSKITWDDYYAFYLKENDQLNAIVTLPANALNPFFEVAILDPNWNYFYIDRTFYETAVNENGGGFVKGSVGFEKYNDNGKSIDYLDSTTFNSTVTTVENQNWNTADCILLQIVGTEEKPIFYYQWDTRNTSGGRIASVQPVAISGDQLRQRKQDALGN